MGHLTGLQTGKIEATPAEEEPSLSTFVPRGAGGTKSWKKPFLLGLGAAVLLGLLIGGILWSRRGMVEVQAGKVLRQDLTAIVTASGEIKPSRENYANVNANSYGKIVEILVKEGDRVKKGQLLMRTESVQQEADVAAQEAALRTAVADTSVAEATVQSAAAAVKTAEADLQQAEARLERAREDFARAEKMLAERLIAQQVYDQRRTDYEVAQATVEAAQARVRQSRSQLQQATYSRDMARARVAQARAALLRAQDVKSKTEYYSPLEGIVTSLPVRVGENVVPGIQNQVGSLLYQVSDLSIITAEVKVDEADIINVKLGQPAEVAIDAIPDKKLKGKVTEIGQSAIGRSSGLTSGQSSSSSEEAKDFRVVVILEEPPPNLRPGLSSTAKITTARREDAITVPIQALAVRQRRELEEGEKETKGKTLAASKEPGEPSAKEKDKGKEELQGVFVVRSGRAVFVPVEIGIMGTTDVEIVKGVQPGEEIVTGSYRALRTLKNNVKVKIGKAEGPPPSSS